MNKILNFWPFPFLTQDLKNHEVQGRAVHFIFWLIKKLNEILKQVQGDHYGVAKRMSLTSLTGAPVNLRTLLFLIILGLIVSGNLFAQNSNLIKTENGFEFDFDTRITMTKNVQFLEKVRNFYYYQMRIQVSDSGLLKGMVKYQETVKSDLIVSVELIQGYGAQYDYGRDKIFLEWRRFAKHPDEFEIIYKVIAKEKLNDEQFSDVYLTWIESQNGLGISRISKVVHENLNVNVKEVKLVPIDD